MHSIQPELRVNVTPGSQVIPLEEGGWRLEIPAGPKGRYRLAQLDDYTRQPRHSLPWTPPVTLKLRARLSAASLPGTWGFGLWNDPFALSLGVGGASRRFPALPNAAWFFYASAPNYLSFRDDKPAQGLLSAAFRSPAFPAPLLALGTPFGALLLWAPTARLMRRLLRLFINEDAASLDANPSEWHTYCLHWSGEHLSFELDEQPVFQTAVRPNPPLGLVLWIDNQYAALPPRGRLRIGYLPNPEPAWLEIAGLELSTSPRPLPIFS
jgi:hypothetical protein